MPSAASGQTCFPSSPWATRAGCASDEDEQCGIYLRNIIEGRKPDFDAVKSLIMTGGATQKFFDDNQPQFHPQDVDLALDVDRYPFAMRISREDGLLVARKHELRRYVL